MYIYLSQLSNIIICIIYISAAHAAFPKWSSQTVKSRAALMLKFHALVRENATELAKLIVLENGKNMSKFYYI